MSRGRAQSLAASPTLVGALTVLIATVAVFLAYNANQGLPFVPTYRLTAEVPNANTLVPGNEVRIGGVRVGVVEDVEPVQEEDGSVNARLDLSLQRDLMPLPEDSTIQVRSRSSLGLKYLQIRQGTSAEGYDEGATIPLSAARPEPVELDQVLSIFDQPTRRASQLNLIEFGNAFAGRGADLNDAIGELAPLLRRLQPVMANISAPSTRLDRFVRSIAAVAGEVAPVAEVNANLFVAMDRTFGAFAEVSRPFIQETISKGPETLDTTIETLPRIRPFLQHTGDLFVALQPGARALRVNGPAIAGSVVEGIPALRVSPAFNAQIPPTAQSLLDFANNAAVREGIDDLIDAAETFNPGLSFIAPAQATCNYITILLRNAGQFLGFGNSIGTYQRFAQQNAARQEDQGPNNQELGPNSEGRPSSGPANGPGPNIQLHSNPYPNTAAPGQTFECEAGNEAWIFNQQSIGNVPGNQGIVTSDQTAAQMAGR